MNTYNNGTENGGGEIEEYANVEDGEIINGLNIDTNGRGTVSHALQKVIDARRNMEMSEAYMTTVLHNIAEFIRLQGGFDAIKELAINSTQIISVHPDEVNRFLTNFEDKGKIEIRKLEVKKGKGKNNIIKIDKETLSYFPIFQDEERVYAILRKQQELKDGRYKVTSIHWSPLSFFWTSFTLEEWNEKPALSEPSEL